MNSIKKQSFLSILIFSMLISCSSPTFAMWSSAWGWTKNKVSAAKGKVVSWLGWDGENDKLKCKVDSKDNEQGQAYSTKKIRIGENEVEAQVVVHNGKELVQLSVKNQFENDGGGGASCGYQTLKNGFEMLLALSGKDVPDFLKPELGDYNWSDQREEHLKVTLKDPGLICQLFGAEGGAWRKEILYNRILIRLRNDVSKEWKKALRKVELIDWLNEVKVFDFYSAVLDSLARDVAQEILDGVVFSNESFNKRLLEKAKDVCRGKSLEDVKEYYLVPDESITHDTLITDICTQKMLERCIDLSKITIPAWPKCKPSDWQWLDGKEMEILINHELEAGRLKELKDKITVLVYEDLSLMGTDADLNYQRLLETFEKIKSDPDHKVLICMGTMKNSRSGQVTGSSGHWFPLIWTSERSYVMDSAINKCRLEDQGVKKVLSVFDGIRAEKK